MNRPAFKRACGLWIAALFLAASAVPAFAAEQDAIGGSTGASAGEPAGDERGDDDWRSVLPEQFWYLDADVRDRMVKDPDVVPMFNAAVTAKHQRRTAGMVLYFVGAPIMVGSFVLFIAPEDLGFDADKADVISISGAAVGASAILTAALVRALDSPGGAALQAVHARPLRRDPGRQPAPPARRRRLRLERGRVRVLADPRFRANLTRPPATLSTVERASANVLDETMPRLHPPRWGKAGVAV